MRSGGVAVALGVVGLLGGILAAVAVSLSTAPSAPDQVEAPPAGIEASGADASARVRAPAAGENADDTPKIDLGQVKRVMASSPLPDPANLPEGTPLRPVLDPIFSTPAESLEALEARFEVGAATRIDLADLSGNTGPAEVERALEQRMFQATATVSAAADAHLAYADKAPRGEADVARAKAAQLYDHLADIVSDAPVPEHFSPERAEVQRSMTERLSERHRRQAAALRSAGGR